MNATVLSDTAGVGTGEGHAGGEKAIWWVCAFRPLEEIGDGTTTTYLTSFTIVSAATVESGCVAACGVRKSVVAIRKERDREFGWK